MPESRSNSKVIGEVSHDNNSGTLLDLRLPPDVAQGGKSKAGDESPHKIFHLEVRLASLDQYSGTPPVINKDSLGNNASSDRKCRSDTKDREHENVDLLGVEEGRRKEEDKKMPVPKLTGVWYI